MASPPPGGSQPPPQPYPGQQTYYAPPITPAPKKSNTLLIVVIIVVVIVAVVAIAWYAITLMLRPVTNPQITVTGVSWTVTYPGSNHFFGNSPLTTCSACPISVTFPDYQFTYTLSLTNADPSAAHNVTGITVSGITFNLVSATPNPTTANPVSVNAGGSVSFTLVIQATPLSGSRTLSGTITTS